MKMKSRDRGIHCWCCGREAKQYTSNGKSKEQMHGDWQVPIVKELRKAGHRAMRTGRLQEGALAEIRGCCGAFWVIR